ncbi:extracellular solute-binding protein [Anaerolineae bacterium CFX7]|nr:extracellular solute-binding protein [Anaerolineae bacterium CFX7]
MVFSRLQIFRWTLWLIGLCGLAIATGCGAAPDLPLAPATPSANSQADVTTLTVWHTLTDDKRAAFETLAQDFHKVYPDLNINAVYVGSRDDLSKQFNAALALGAAPDLILADRRQIANFAATGGLQPLESFLQDADLGLTKQDQNDFLNGALTLGNYPTLDAQTFGMPFDQEAFVLFYNADRLKDFNRDAPPRTWDEFAEWSKLASSEKTYGWALYPNAAMLEAMLASRGSALLTDAGTRALFNERAGLAVMKMTADLTKANYARIVADETRAQREFAAGNAAFYLGWMSELDTLQALQKQAKQKFEIALAPLPENNADETWLLARGDLFGLATAPQGRTDAQRARNAWFFVRWITAPTQSAQWVRATNAIPLRASTLQFIAPDLNTNARFRQIAGAFGNRLPNLVAQPATPSIETIEQQAAGLWLQVTEPQADIAARLDALAERVNLMLAVKP